MLLQSGFLTLSVKYLLLLRNSLSRSQCLPRSQSQSSVKPTGDVGTKTIQLQEGDDSKTAIIGAGLGDK